MYYQSKDPQQNGIYLLNNILILCEEISLQERRATAVVLFQKTEAESSEEEEEKEEVPKPSPDADTVILFTKPTKQGLLAGFRNKFSFYRATNTSLGKTMALSPICIKKKVCFVLELIV